MTESPGECNATAQPLFSVVLPYHIEANFLGHTLLSRVNKKKNPNPQILVNNGSTEGSGAIARDVLKEISSIEVSFLPEPRPGKLHTLWDRGLKKGA